LEANIARSPLDFLMTAFDCRAIDFDDREINVEDVEIHLLRRS
jgi:hypothetical protein